MNSSKHCPVVGCGETGVLLSPLHDPFATITFELLADTKMELACGPHSHLLWDLYADRAVRALMSVALGIAASGEASEKVAWRLNSQNDRRLKEIAARITAGFARTREI